MTKIFTRLPPDALEYPEYESFDTIRRVMHVDDAIECFQSKCLMSHEVPREANSCLSRNKSNEFIWFGIKKEESSSWYGNVSFEIKLEDLISLEPNLKFYYLEYVQFRKDSISRVLITKKDRRRLNLPYDVIEMDFHRKGFPIYKDGNKFCFLTDYQRIDGRSNVYGHNVEILIDSDLNMDEILFNNCKRVPVDHDPNTIGNDGQYLDKKCHKYNKKKMYCPYRLTSQETREYIRNKHFSFWNDDYEVMEGLGYLIGAAIGITSGIYKMYKASKN